MARFDYVSEQAKAKGDRGTELIVRAGNKYGEAGPGDHVLVDKATAKAETRRHPMSKEPLGALMTSTEQREIAAKRRKAKTPPPAPRLKAAVDAGLAKLRRHQAIEE